MKEENFVNLTYGKIPDQMKDGYLVYECDTERLASEMNADLTIGRFIGYKYFNPNEKNL
jgi:hypothetical protein